MVLSSLAIYKKVIFYTGHFTSVNNSSYNIKNVLIREKS